jgi:hypothetical protein
MSAVDGTWTENSVCCKAQGEVNVVLDVVTELPFVMVGVLAVALGPHVCGSVV